MRVINCNSWKFIPMSQPMTTSYERELSFNEWETFKIGLALIEMEDKWFIFIKEKYVYFCRSWTGNCIFKLEIQVKTNNCYVLNNIELIDNVKILSMAEMEDKINFLNDLINIVLNYNKKWISSTMKIFFEEVENNKELSDYIYKAFDYKNREKKKIVFIQKN